RVHALARWWMGERGVGVGVGVDLGLRRDPELAGRVHGEPAAAQRLVAVVAHHHQLAPFEGLSAERAVHDDEPSAAVGSRTTILAPLPSSLSTSMRPPCSATIA